MRRNDKIFILILEGIIKKISYERRDYESVDEKTYLSLCRDKLRKKEFRQQRVNFRVVSWMRNNSSCTKNVVIKKALT